MTSRRTLTLVTKLIGLSVLFLTLAGAGAQELFPLDLDEPEEKDEDGGIVLEAEDHVAEGADGYRDKRASGKLCAGRILSEGARPVTSGSRELPPGDYVAVFRLSAAPVDILHHLKVRLRAGSAGWALQQFHFDPSGVYQDFRLAFTHPGGRAGFSVAAGAESGFDGMRRDVSEREKEEYGEKLLEETLTGPGGGEDEMGAALDELEEYKSVANFEPVDYRLLCDRVEIVPARESAVLVREVNVDRVHYRPGETVRATARLVGASGGGSYRLVARDVTELDKSREVFSREVRVEDGADTSVEFSYEVGENVFGHELRCALEEDGEEVHSGSAYFGVTEDVYRMGICGDSGPQGVQGLTRERAAQIMRGNKRSYANYFERFAWAPCDYSNLAPDRELFWSGQTQYPGSITGFQNLIGAAHEVGVKAITYGKACAAGIDGFQTFRRHPEYFKHRPRGPVTEKFNVFYLERMLANDYNLRAKPIDGGWQHWASLWTNWANDETVRFGARAIMDSIEMFGWDGVRWDGHFTNKQQIFLDMFAEQYPEFVHGYNTAFAGPGTKQFIPRRPEDLETISRDHGLIMDESVRNWSHTNFSPGTMRPFYGALCREADYVKRLGGLPLFITFDMASPQDQAFNVLCGLAAGERYCYLTSPGEFAYGPLPKFLTRYAAFVWDDTRRVAAPAKRISVEVGEGPEDAEPWWRESVWLREAPGGRQQILVNLLNPPGYPAFCNRVQTPPSTLREVRVGIETPEGAELTRVVHISPDLVDGHEVLEAQSSGGATEVTVPRLRTWSIVLAEYEGGTTLLFPVTTPVQDAKEVLAAREKKKQEAAAKKHKEEKPKTVRYYRDFENLRNVDEKKAGQMDKPETLRLVRNGEMDVHHARGAFSWLNPLGSAVGMLGGGRYKPSWVDYVGFKLGAKGCMDEFPDTYQELMSYDVLVLDDLHSFHLGGRRRVMAADFVRSGGGLIYFGGYFNLSLGADHNTFLEQMVPVRINRYKDIVHKETGLTLEPVEADFFGDVDWSDPPAAFTVDTSELDEDARVLVKAGGHPAIVASEYGDGRVLTVLMNSHGPYAGGVRPYWEWAQWPKVLAACVRWAAAGYEETTELEQAEKEIDRSKPQPMDLMMGAFDTTPEEFTQQVKQARVNVVDTESARVLLRVATDNLEKIRDLDVLKKVVAAAAPYFDDSFAPLGEKLVDSQHAFIREAGYRILGRAGDPRYREMLEKGLRDDNDLVVRQTLIGLARLGDAESVPALRRYLKRGSEKLLAAAALKRCGYSEVLARGLRLYSEALEEKIDLKCGRRSLEETLWGGVSFKLTPKQRRKLMSDYRDLREVEAQNKFDIEFFEASLRDLGEEEIQTLTEFFAQTENRQVLPFAYAFFANLPEGQAQEQKGRLAEAELEGLRMLSRQ